ncbi:4-(cytidine 5'-diphospho)-2-C-methyl-D-erythritol kinase [Butyricicoccus pullicaecorum]|uniref:4-(cytidine 5'-diphospho)-2-C-methyl-D-erythritol kinase n=1 Tax=Butyricicoccus pullicaecorum TaxID=501571 RepID=UPI00352181AE
MNSIKLDAHAKINLTLDVTGKLNNGYHTVRMVMQSVGLHDDVTVEKTDDGQITLTCDRPYVPTDDRNLAVRAANAFFAHTGLVCPGLRIDICKRIPVAAGLAGGSTDAAAVLRALDTLFETNLGLDTLCEIGLTLGADVPYCLRGGTMLAEGIGEVLSPLPAAPHCLVVLCKPAFAVSTAAVYAQIDDHMPDVRPDTAGMCQALAQGDYNGVCHRLYNVMEAVTAVRHAEIGQIKDILLSCGADGAAMSGSGPTTFGLFHDPDKAQAAFDRLKAIFPDTHLTEIL